MRVRHKEFCLCIDIQVKCLLTPPPYGYSPLSKGKSQNSQPCHINPLRPLQLKSNKKKRGVPRLYQEKRCVPSRINIFYCKNKPKIFPRQRNNPFLCEGRMHAPSRHRHSLDNIQHKMINHGDTETPRWAVSFAQITDNRGHSVKCRKRHFSVDFSRRR